MSPLDPGPADPSGPEMHEGPEEPPPGVKVMGIVRWALVAIMAVVAAATVLSQIPGLRGGDRHGAEHGEVYYCPMHPQIQQPGPGECPICGMTLVKKPAGTVKPSTSMQPALAEPSSTADGGTPPTAVVPGEFTCPMHPQVVTRDPKARCPICGMKLVPRVAQPAAPVVARPVPGLVPVELSQERVQLIGVRTEKATRSALGGELRTVGAVEADERGLAQITVRFSGWVEKLLVAETGQRVRKGQVLATIYSPELLQAQEELLSAQRWARSAPPGTPSPASAHPGHSETSQSLVVDARHRLELLGIADQEIEAILREGKPRRAIGVRSPVDGHAIGRNVLAGMAVQPGMALFEVADLSRLWVTADVYQGEAARVKVGQVARFSVAAFPGETFTGKVQLIYPQLESGSRTLRLRIELVDGKTNGKTTGRLRPGMFGDVFLDLPGTTAVTVPAEAVVETGEHQYVFVARDGGRFEPRLVKLGSRAADRVEVKEGLAEGETVVTTANFLIDSESRLRATIQQVPATKPPATNPPAPDGGRR